MPFSRDATQAAINLMAETYGELAADVACQHAARLHDDGDHSRADWWTAIALGLERLYIAERRLH